VTVAQRPEEFAGGDALPGGGENERWEVDGMIFDRNPRRLLTVDDNEMMRIWHWTRVGDFGGARPLPDAGGIQDQAAVMLDAIRIMDAAYARLKKAERR
jgi:hypothetical protein